MTSTCLDETTDLILGEEPNLRGVARRLVRCDSDADDLVQDTLLRAYHARRRFRPGSSVRAWTSTILRRLFLTRAVRAKRRGTQTDTDSGGMLDAAVGRTSSPHDDPAADFEALGERLDDEVKRALDRIPEIYRTSFFLSAVRNLTCAEIALQLSVAPGTVMSRVHRARERLRDDLAVHRPASAAAPRRRTGRAPVRRLERS
jgi:RNA polymerase sigma-70 factor (ECF subfamily)